MTDKVSVIDFSPPDDERIIKQFKLRENAEKRAKSNHPVSSATQLDQVEQQVLSAFQQDCSDKKQDILSTIQASEEDIATQKARLLDGSYISDAEVELAQLKQYFKGFSRQYLDKKQLHQEKVAEFKKFRTDRELLEPPGERQGVFWYSLDLLLLIAIESMLNMYFFKSGNELGLLGGFIEAIGIAGFNVAFWFVIGWWGLKRINSVIWYNKLFGYLLFLFAVVSLPISHFLVGFYRDMLTSGITTERGEALQHAWSMLSAMNFKSLSPSSILLILLGIMMAGWALQKGYKYGHRYPGYSAKYEEFQKSSNSFQILEEELRGEYIESLAEIRTQLGEQIQSIEPRIRDIASMRTRIDTYISKWEIYLKACCKSLNGLLASYRDINAEARSDSAPKYFAELFFSEPQLGGDKIKRSVGKDLIDIDAQIDKIRQQADRVLQDVIPLEDDINQLLDWDDGS